MPFTDLAAEVASEVRLLRATQAGLEAHATQREDAYRWADPGGLARSLPGLAAIGAPAHRPTLAVGVSGLRGAWDVPGAIIGDASRFPTAAISHSKAGPGAAAHPPGPRRGPRSPPGPDSPTSHPHPGDDHYARHEPLTRQRR
jgi:hypothetical protein